jgi:predicted ATPase/signal transduction histidine kinase/CheY-like chemotaxis protein
MNRLAIPNKLYGRDKQILKLLESFEHISSGYGQVLMVPGASGVGKTALVQELQIPIIDRNGFFARGKFEQYQQNIPYFAFRQAMAELCKKLNAGNESEFSRLKSDILQSVGTMGQVLVDFVPEFELLLGPQPPLIDISPQEARHRFADVFQNFLKVICSPEHPLVLFIDDWQWADAASCELLKQLHVGIKLRYLLVIISYRNNEVGSGHPLISAINDLKIRNITVEELQVNNITKNDVKEFISDTFRQNVHDIEGLATFIHGKTLGNPFFVRSFLSFLHEFKHIWFNSGENQWRWHIQESDDIELPNNIVELFAIKFRKLDEQTQNLFFLAACLGNRFDLETLGIISSKPPQRCRELLFSSNAKEMLLPDDQKVDNQGSKVITFLHDRVQQAAFTLVEPDKIPVTLLKIGRLLLSRLTPEQLDERLFEVVNNLNTGSHLIVDATEQKKMVELNITAARKAYNATAYGSALQFYRAANQYLNNPAFAAQIWVDHHELIMNLFKERAICEFLEGDRSIAEICVHEAVSHSKTALEKAQALNILIVHFTLTARYPEAIASGSQALAALGISLPVDNFEVARDSEIAQVRQTLKTRSFASLFEMPIMINPEMLMASRILIAMGPPCYRSHQQLWSVIVPKVVNLTLRFGNIPQVGYSHTAMGGLLGWVDNDYTTAKSFSELASQLMSSTFRDPSDQSVFYLMIGSSIRHWFKHLSFGVQDYTDAYEIGLRSGNLQYAAYAFGHKMYCRFFQGVPLAGLIQETQHSLEFSKTRLNKWAIDLIEGGLNIFDILSNENKSLDGDINWSDEKYLQKVDDHHNIQVKCIYNVLKTQALLISGHIKKALELSDQTEPIIYTVGTQGLLPWPEHVFARILIITALYPKADATQQMNWRTELDVMMNRLHIWSENCSANFEHKYLLAAAEIARIDENQALSMQHYDQAIEAAQAGHFLQWEALANERTADFWMASENERLANVYWQQAYVCYNRWGAKAKVNSMENAYRKMVKSGLPVSNTSMAIHKYQDIFVEKQVNLIRNYAQQMQQTQLRIEAEIQADELAMATQRLRLESAERKKAKEEINSKNEELQKLNATKDKFFSIIAHDLKSPFNAIVSLSEALVKHVNNQHNEKSLKYAQIINQSANSAMGLLTNLMEWARSQTGRMQFNPEYFDIAELINHVELLLIDTAKQKSIKFSNDFPANVRVFADQEMISTILRNLISNALKFTDAGGRITVSIDNQPNEWIVSVADTGIGISQDNIEKLFRIDESFSTQGTQNETGTGLGLILCKDFIENHGGEIWVESTEGDGSIFSFSIPKGTNKLKTEDPSNNSEYLNVEGVSSLKILISETKEAWSISKVIAPLCSKIIQTKTDAETIDACRQNPDIDLFFIDFKAQGINGPEIIRQIRLFNKYMVIIAISSSENIDDEKTAIKAGGDDCIFKPINDSTLLAMILKHFKK